jgi:hypothetical protein
MSKEITVSGASWPLFVYKNEEYDEDEPWNGLFRSRILVKVRYHDVLSPSNLSTGRRRSSMYLHPPALSRKKRKQLGRATPEFTG